MIRAAAKNYRDVAVLTDPAQYPVFMELMKQKRLDEKERLKLALAAIKTTAHYDQFIFNTLNRLTGTDAPPLAFGKLRELRYGENPHQRAWLAKWKNSDARTHLADAKLLQGKKLSYNNLVDADAAWKCNSELHNAHPGKALVSIVKHGSPCGVALAGDNPEAAEKALEEAWACDPVSSFGSVIAFNREVGEHVAAWFSDKFVEIIIAPSFSRGARAIFSRKKNLRLLACDNKAARTGEKVIKSINGGILIQDEDELQQYEFRKVTEEAIPPEKQELCLFGIIVNKYLKSNSIALVTMRRGAMILAGAGMGQPNRLDSLKMLAAPRARAKAGGRAAGQGLIQQKAGRNAVLHVAFNPWRQHCAHKRCLLSLQGRD